jgi:hypothetical protein
LDGKLSTGIKVAEGDYLIMMVESLVILMDDVFVLFTFSNIIDAIRTIYHEEGLLGKVSTP